MRVGQHAVGAAAQALQGVEDEDGIAEAVGVGGIQAVGELVPVDGSFARAGEDEEQDEDGDGDQRPCDDT